MTLTNVLGVELVCWVLMVFYVGGTLLLLTSVYLKVGASLVRLCDWMNHVWWDEATDSFDPADPAERKVAILWSTFWPLLSTVVLIGLAATGGLLAGRLARRSSMLRSLGHAVFVSPFEPRRAPPTARAEEREP